ncbi:ABATE domain-containing protein [Amycolatopsis sp. NBC_00345]|uniref:CGNR zinc finger domain-containing protein n=1 Tax=Amycolatopsis sp. NBC_00345 TaxID=2975955 RepID=UPI002E25DAC5
MEHAFPCENPALDFVGTLRARRNAAPLEKLGSPGSLDAWFLESGTVDAGPGSRPADLAAALTLREAIYSLVAARLTHQSYDDEALTLLNHAASRPPVVPQLTREGRRVEATAEQALSAVARAAVDILGGSDAELLKECGRPECTQVYLDHSRGFRREWCSMATCGNKMKAAAYRARQRGNPPLSRSRQSS